MFSEYRQRQIDELTDEFLSTNMSWQEFEAELDYILGLLGLC